MRYHEIICEGRDAPLFHGTSFSQAVGIIKDDAMRAASPQAHVPNIPTEKGVSLSRSRSVAQQFGNVVFVFDQAKLAQTHRLVPIDYWSQNNEPELAGHGRRKGPYAEAEEFLIGPMNCMDRYLLRIEIKQKYYDRVVKEHPEYAKPLIDHPKLTIV